MNVFIRCFTALCVSISLFGCAAIIHGTRQDVTINSSPAAADVEVKTEGGVIVFNGKTPSSFRLERKQSYNVVVKLPGYKETTVRISKEFDMLFLGNLLCGGLIGMIIDAATGAMYKLEPDTINVGLVTASSKSGRQDTYVVFRSMDSEGQIRNLVVPVVKL